MALTREQVEALIAVSERATPGPWVTENVNGILEEDGNYTALAICRDDHNEQNNAEFIAASRNLMPQLARDWLRMRSALDEMITLVCRMQRHSDYELSDAEFEELNKAVQALADIDAGSGAEEEAK